MRFGRCSHKEHITSKLYNGDGLVTHPFDSSNDLGSRPVGTHSLTKIIPFTGLQTSYGKIFKYNFLGRHSFAYKSYLNREASSPTKRQHSLTTSQVLNLPCFSTQYDYPRNPDFALCFPAPAFDYADQLTRREVHFGALKELLLVLECTFEEVSSFFCATSLPTI